MHIEVHYSKLKFTYLNMFSGFFDKFLHKQLLNIKCLYSSLSIPKQVVKILKHIHWKSFKYIIFEKKGLKFKNSKENSAFCDKINEKLG